MKLTEFLRKGKDLLVTLLEESLLIFFGVRDSANLFSPIAVVYSEYRFSSSKFLAFACRGKFIPFIRCFRAAWSEILLSHSNHDSFHGFMLDLHLFELLRGQGSGGWCLLSSQSPQQRRSHHSSSCIHRFSYRQVEE